MRIRDWSSDVCSSDLPHPPPVHRQGADGMTATVAALTESEIAALRARFPEVLDPDIRRVWLHRALVAGFAGYVAFCVWVFEITFARLFGGLDRMWIIIRYIGKRPCRESLG